jgi:hypothetical protein
MSQLILTVALLGSVCAMAAGVPAASRPWLAPGQPIAARVKALMAAMTPEEQSMQLVYECAGSWVWNQSSWASTGIGSVGIERSTPPPDCDMACRIAALRGYQQGALAESRLGIPVTFVIETSHCGGREAPFSPWA